MASLLVTAAFHLRYVRTQRDFLATRRPWADFLGIALLELSTVLLAASWLLRHAFATPPVEQFLVSFCCGPVDISHQIHTIMAV